MTMPIRLSHPKCPEKRKTAMSAVITEANTCGKDHRMRVAAAMHTNTALRRGLSPQ